MDVKAVKEVIGNKKLVTYDNANYTVTAYILRFNGKTWQHTLELKDLKAKSVRIVPIGNVEVRE